MIIGRLGIVAPRGQRQELGKALVSLVGPTQVQPGCLGCRLLQNWQETDQLVIETDWATEENLVRHLQSDIYKRLLMLLDLGRTPPLLQYYRVEQVSGLELVEKARNCFAISDDADGDVNGKAL